MCRNDSSSVIEGYPTSTDAGSPPTEEQNNLVPRITHHSEITLILSIVFAIIDVGDSDSQVDGVMGGKSSGELTFLESNTVMNFTGIINLGGGGFSSVIKSFRFVVELETTRAHDPNNIDAPLGFYICNSMTQLLDILAMRRHSLFHCPARLERRSESIFLEQVLTEDRGSTDYGYLRAVQDGPFEVNVKQISAVNDPQTFASSSPVISLSSTYEIKTLIDRTIHRSVLNTILTAKGGDVTSSIKNIMCQGLDCYVLKLTLDIGSK
eukprot:scaffold13980_cov133-Skeletonema_dohrnii-CCMP3373.AAC.3